MPAKPYKQVLPALKLSLERGTDAVPADGAWYLIRDGIQIGRYRTLSAAQDVWRDVVHASGWKPPKRQIDVADVRRREQTERWSRNRAG